MSAACGCDKPTTSPADEAEEAERPWWRDPGLVVPILSGVAFGTGLALEWSGLHIAALVAFWAGLLLGAYTFVRVSPSSRESTAGWLGLSSRDIRMRERVGSAMARPSRFMTSRREAMVSMH